MDLDEFKDLVGRCGEQSESWPADIRQEALEFVSASDAAQEFINIYQELTLLFRATLPVRAPKDLVDKIMSEIKRSSHVA